MAKTKGRIPIAAAQRLSETYKCQVVVVFAIEEGGDRFTVTTYGATKKLCKLAAGYGDQIAQKVMDATIVKPLQDERNLERFDEAPGEWDSQNPPEGYDHGT